MIGAFKAANSFRDLLDVEKKSADAYSIQFAVFFLVAASNMFRRDFLKRVQKVTAAFASAIALYICLCLCLYGCLCLCVCLCLCLLPLASAFVSSHCPKL